MFEVLFHPRGQLLQFTQMAHGGFDQLSLGAGGCFSRNRGLEVSIQALIGVELRAVGGQVEYFDFLAILGQPRFHHPRMVYPQIVQN